MVDNRRWNTQQIIDGGILSRPMPESKRPGDAKLVSVDDDDLSPETLKRGLEAGGLRAYQYYGCWEIWKTKNGYSGELFQYRAVTDSFDDVSIDDAVQKAETWASNCYG